MALVSYWGPKDYDRLAALPYGLEPRSTWASSESWPSRSSYALHWIHDNIVANYGWAIILMTMLIKILLLPLTHKSTVSMQKMQELNPKVQAIRDRYRTKLRDKQGKPNLEMQRKMNEEMMALYKEARGQPGGRLPPAAPPDADPVRLLQPAARRRSSCAGRPGSCGSRTSRWPTPTTCCRS